MEENPVYSFELISYGWKVLIYFKKEQKRWSHSREFNIWSDSSSLHVFWYGKNSARRACVCVWCGGLILAHSEFRSYTQDLWRGRRIHSHQLRTGLPECQLQGTMGLRCKSLQMLFLFLRGWQGCYLAFLSSRLNFNMKIKDTYLFIK